MGCITDADPDNRFWCSTKVDDNLEHIGGGGHWAYCSESCSPILSEAQESLLPTIIETKTSPTTSAIITTTSATTAMSATSETTTTSAETTTLATSET